MTIPRKGHKTTSRTHQPRRTSCGFERSRRWTNLQPPGGLPALDRAPPPPLSLSVLDRAPPPELPGPGRPCRPLGRVIRGGADQAGGRRRQEDDLRRIESHRLSGGDVERAQNAEQEASVAAERAEQAVAQAVASAAAGATAAPSPSTHPQGVASERPRPGDNAFFMGSVTCMASVPRVRFLPSVGDRSGGNGLRPPHVRGAGVAVRGRPFSGDGLDSHRLYVLCRTDESRPDSCPRQGPADGPRQGARPRLLAEPRRKTWRNATGGNSDAATVATAGTAPVGVVASGVAAKMVGVVKSTTAAGVTAVMEAGEARRVLVVAHGAAEGATLVATTGAVPAALAEATEGGGTAREDVQRGTARQRPPARLRARAWTPARGPW